jgi:hypothetical protein
LIPDKRAEHRAQGYEDARAVILLGARAAVNRTPPYRHPDKWGEGRSGENVQRALDALDYIDGAWQFVAVVDGA